MAFIRESYHYEFVRLMEIVDDVVSLFAYNSCC